jgi:hypothetical protein
MPRNDATFPSAWARSMSAADRAGINASGYRAIIRRAMSNSSSWTRA